MGTMKDVLKNIPIFSGLNEVELSQLETITSKRTYKKKRFVFMEGDDRESVFFILSGVVKAHKINEDGNEQVISLLHAGDMFPHVGFFDHSPYPATVEVIHDAELFVIRIDDFDELIIKRPHIAIKVMKIMGQKILHLQERVQDLISKDIHYRLTHALVRLTEEKGKEQETGIYIDLPITNQDFANMIGTSRESINRILNQLKKEKVLKVDRQGILIYDIDKLQQYC